MKLPKQYEIPKSPQVIPELYTRNDETNEFFRVTDSDNFEKDVTWEDISNKPQTFPPTIGTTAGTALAGNTVIPPKATWDNLDNKPPFIAAGTTKEEAREAIDAIDKALIGAPNGIAQLDSSGVVPLDQLNISSLTYKGTWNPTNNTPELTNEVGKTGDFYKVSQDGEYTFGEESFNFFVGDWVIYADGFWQRVGVHETVFSVNGQTGNVIIDEAPVTSVNSKTGDVVLTAADVGALPDNHATKWEDLTDKPPLVVRRAPLVAGQPVYNPAIVAFSRCVNDVQVIPSGVNAELTLFTGDGFDTFNMQASSHALTIPSWAARARIYVNLVMDNMDEGADKHCLLRVYHDGVILGTSIGHGLGDLNPPELSIVTGVYQVNGGGTIRLFLRHNNDTPLSTSSINPNSSTLTVELFEEIID